MAEQLESKFKSASEEVRHLTKRPTNDELLNLYGLFKQSTDGDNKTPKPGFFDFKGNAKWKAWGAQTGSTKEQAMTKYIELVESLKTAYFYDPNAPAN